jgi:acetyl esterase
MTIDPRTAPLDPQATEFLEACRRAPRPPLWSVPVEVSRAGVVSVSLGPEPVGRVWDEVVTTTQAAIPMRLYEPENDGRGTAVFFHGGGWVTGNLDTHDALCRRVCREGSCRVVSVNYRHAPEHPFPAAFHDACAATSWAADRFPGDPVGVWGDSAGGNLAAAVALEFRGLGRPKLAAQALVYPITDCGLDTASYENCAEGFFLTKRMMQWFWEQYIPDAAMRANPRASVLRESDLTGLPPTLLLTAEFDVLRDEGRAYAARLREAGVSVTEVEYPGMIHSFIRRIDLFTAASDAARRVGTHLRQHFGGTPSIGEPGGHSSSEGTDAPADSASPHPASTLAPGQVDRFDEEFVDEVIRELNKPYDGVLPERAIREAQRLGPAIKPRLIDLLRSAAAAVRQGLPTPGEGHVLALFLLGEFRATEALPVLLECLALPGEGPFELFGDAITESLPRILAVLATDTPETIDSLIADASLNEYVRWASTETYLHWVLAGRMSRQQAARAVQSHLERALTENDTLVVDPLASELFLFGQPESDAVIREAINRGLVDTHSVRLRDLNRTEQQADADFERSLERCDPAIQDTLAELRDWAAYRPPESTICRESSTDDDWDREEFAEDLRPALAPPFHRTSQRVGRNDSCPCGSGKKYKKCCGRSG